MDTKDKTMLSNVKKTINGYKKAQSDEKELGSQLKVLKAVYNLWHLNSLMELDNIYKAQILAFLALGYKALGLDRDALVFAHNYLTLHTEIVANKLPSKDLNMLQELETQIKALVRSCSRRRFDLSVRTIGIDLFIHVKSFIDYLKAEIASLKELSSDTDKQAAKFNHIIKLLKSNASCILSLAPSGKLLVSLNNESDDVELATFYAAFMAAVNSYGKELTEAVTFVVSAQAQAQGQAQQQQQQQQQHTTKEQALAYAGALLKSSELICPTFLQDVNCWNNNSRNLNLEPLQEEALAQVKSEPPSEPSTDLIKDESDTAPATEAPSVATAAVMSENTTAQETEPTAETAEQSTLASDQDFAAVAANSQEPSTSNDANNTSTPMASNNDAAITIDAKSQAPRVEELGLSYSYTAVVTANSREPSSQSSTNPQDSASSQSQNQANAQAQSQAQAQEQSPITNSSGQDNAPASELAVVQDKTSTSEPSVYLSLPEGNETCSQESSDANSNHAANTQSEPEAICTSEPELAPKSEVNPAPEQEIESVPAKNATATASAVEAKLVLDTETKANHEVETTTALEQEPAVSTAPEAEAKATTEANQSASEQGSTQSSFDKESTATPTQTAPAPETKEQIATSNHEIASEPKPVAKKVIKPSPIIASNAYQSNEQPKAKGGFFGFIRRIFVGK